MEDEERQNRKQLVEVYEFIKEQDIDYKKSKLMNIKLNLDEIKQTCIQKSFAQLMNQFLTY